ncbi:glycosyltransferase family 2 protein [Flammeovirga pectinis]|uniref:Glycosyltransferase family 2 protein n=1 Tax=Flammeovirga pectinis TaxID=2494373 RepID=A0A3Q9FLS5_9BACT|nr:glycosyltransferase family 2 protein [Flammeovirga pectinis]AZQ61546.1 glycosyltransferase family 2 protein [Flammeovirga pectinis]
MKLSFIIIGKNEGKTLKMCIDSIDLVINKYKYDYEIIYVDSKSKDNSLEICNSNNIKTYKITGDCNAAIARNIGALESKGNILCFLDADMEIEVDFIDSILNNNKLIHPFVSGQLKNLFYDENWNYLSEDYLHKNLNKDSYQYTTGGYFIINREAWFLVNGMKTKFRRSQDIDFGLRLSNIGIPLLRKNRLFVKHHTIAYNDKSRMWKMLFDGSNLYSNSLIIREHLFNKFLYPSFLRKYYSLLVLFFCIIISITSGNILPIIFYLFFMCIKVSKQKISTNYLNQLINQILIDFTSLIGLIIFHPKNKNEKYIKEKS